jgi:hypothetical protein
MILVSLALAIITGLLLGRLMGFMAGEFMVRPFILLARAGAALFGMIAAWGSRLP